MDARECLARLASTGTPPDPETALKISVGLKERISRFRNETLPFIAAGGAELQFVFAPYGRGKTHLLKALQQTAHEGNFVSAYVDCANGRSPFASLRTTYSQIATSLNPPLASRQSSSRVGGIRELVREALATAQSEPLREVLGRLTSDARLSTGYRNLVAAFARTVWHDCAADWKVSQLKDQLGAMLNASSSIQVNMSRLYKEWPNLRRPIAKLSKRNAAAWVRSVAALPVALGFPGLVIFFDETEKTHSMKKLSFQVRQEHLANLRNLVDHLATGAFRGCAIFYAVVEEFLDIARDQLEALSQRIERIRLGTDRPAANLRAVWTDLDELTSPNPESPEFFRQLTDRIISIGTDAGLSSNSAEKLASELYKYGTERSDSIYSGVVREFVKIAAGRVGVELSSRRA